MADQLYKASTIASTRSTAVGRLFLPSSPTTVLRRIITVIVQTFKSGICQPILTLLYFKGCQHVVSEILKLMPPFANPYSPSAVIRVLPHRRHITPLTHSLPPTVERVTASSCSKSVFGANLLVITAARFCVTACDVVVLCLNQLSTITSKQPGHLLSYPFVCGLNRRKPIKFLTSNISPIFV